MSRQVKGKLRLFLAYMSVLSIGVLIYIIIILFANDAKNGLSTIKSLESFGKNGAKKGDSSGIITSADSSVFVGVESLDGKPLDKDASNDTKAPNIELSPIDSVSLNALPDEINSAIDSIETPLESRNDSNKNATKNADSTAQKASDSKIFPRDFIVRVKVLNVRETPSTESAVLKRFKEGAVIRISKVDGKWAELENGGWAYLSLLRER